MHMVEAAHHFYAKDKSRRRGLGVLDCLVANRVDLSESVTSGSFMKFHFNIYTLGNEAVCRICDTRLL